MSSQKFYILTPKFSRLKWTIMSHRCRTESFSLKSIQGPTVMTYALRFAWTWGIKQLPLPGKPT